MSVCDRIQMFYFYDFLIFTFIYFNKNFKVCLCVCTHASVHACVLTASVAFTVVLSLSGSGVSLFQKQHTPQIDVTL